MEFCLECHSSSGALETCVQCSQRAFHKSCQKTEAQRRDELDEIDYHKNQEGVPRKYSEYFDKSAIVDENICYACTLLKGGDGRSQDEELSIAEVNLYLKFVINRVISWLPSDIPGVDEIKAKPGLLKYTKLEEFLVDVLDLLHQNALDFGGNFE